MLGVSATPRGFKRQHQRGARLRHVMEYLDARGVPYKLIETYRPGTHWPRPEVRHLNWLLAPGIVASQEWGRDDEPVGITSVQKGEL